MRLLLLEQRGEKFLRVFYGAKTAWYLLLWRARLGLLQILVDLTHCTDAMWRGNGCWQGPDDWGRAVVHAANRGHTESFV
jgi:hypothetical protein